MATAPPQPLAPATAKRPMPPMPPKPVPRGQVTDPPKALPSFAVRRGTIHGAERIGIYGPGGVGKTELVSLLQLAGIEPLFIDLENGSRNLDVQRVEPAPRNFDEVRAVLTSDELLRPFGAVVIDTVTMLEQMAVAWTLANVKTEKGVSPSSIEAYGWGKGYTYVYESFLLVLGDLDRLIERGIHVILVMHDCVANVPNPDGEDFIRYEPRLLARKDASIRNRVKEWLDHLFFVGFDVWAKDGKASGGGTRSIYTSETPTCWAKSRRLSEPLVYDQGAPLLWEQLFRA